LETFIARQPIFDSRQKVFAYELLYRSSLDNVFRNPDPDQATSKVITDAFFLFNIAALTDGKRAFINLTRDTLIKEYTFLLPRESLVLEIPETMELDGEVIAACKKLKQAGYLLALDDYVPEERYAPLMEVTDFIKVDFISTKESERRSLVKTFAPLGIHLLAEKVETPQEFAAASEMGYTYFQGYFFCKPVVITGKSIAEYKLHYFQLLQEIHHPEMDYQKLEEIIKREVSISYKLLRYINSAFFGLRKKVNSIRQALALLGEREIKKWVSLLALASMGQNKPEELAVQAITRAKFCESCAPHMGLRSRADDLFLVGLFSLIDAFLDRPLSDILKEIPINDEIRGAILGEENRLGEVYHYLLSYEKGDWTKLTEQQERLRIDETRLPQIYLDALKWGQEVFQRD